MTLAFSLKSNMWTTEYSFEPKCYAETDGRMLSFKEIESSGPNRTRKIWLHDDAPERNLFYGESYPSKISVVSNENPSATKTYETVSLETSYSDWSMNVETQEQSGSTDVFVQKENDQYAEVPRDVKITGANLTYIGTCSAESIAINAQTTGIKMSSLSGKMAVGVLCFRYKSDVDPLLKDQVVAIDSVRQGEFRPVLGTQAQQHADFVKVVGLDKKNLLISDPPATSGNGVGNDEEYFNRTNQVEVWVASPDSGESMKGDYIVIDLETKPNPTNFELYAINVDQHKVNLDHSLGQNN